ncbi:MAG: DUF2391 family protein [Candidatus Omnitrophica bacterium]|nr:DUF2391 family protein [Candidatus Omnitrophota bacterium]
MEDKNQKTKVTIKRIGGYLHRVTQIIDGTGNVIHSIATPFQVELKPRDIFQIIIGSYLLAVPVAFTEEVWVLSEQLPLKNIFCVALLSLVFISLFVYFNFYRFNIKGYRFKYIKRVLATYGCSLIAVGLFLTIITKCPWGLDNLLAIKRIILVTFPASMAATITDSIK